MYAYSRAGIEHNEHIFVPDGTSLQWGSRIVSRYWKPHNQDWVVAPSKNRHLKLHKAGNRHTRVFSNKTSWATCTAVTAVASETMEKGCLLFFHFLSPRFHFVPLEVLECSSSQVSLCQGVIFLYFLIWVFPWRKETRRELHSQPSQAFSPWSCLSFLLFLSPSPQKVS